LGENEDGQPLARQSLMAKKIWQRMVILVAGPLFNLILAVLLYGCIFITGKTELKALVGELDPQSMVFKQGLRPWDTIISLNDQSVHSWQDIQRVLQQSVGQKDAIKLRVNTAGRSADRVVLCPSLQTSELASFKQWLKDTGLTIPEAKAPGIVEEILPDEPAFKAGLKPMDEIVAINQTLMPGRREISLFIRAHPLEKIQLQILRAGKEMPIFITPLPKTEAGSSYGYIGVKFKAVELPKEWLYQHKMPVVQALGEALSRTWTYSVLTLKAFYQMGSGSLSTSHLSGPVGIAREARDSVSLGIQPFLEFLSLMSISLALLNLMPIPLLDGGQMLLCVLEALKGKPLTPKFKEAAHKLGFLLIISLMTLGIYNDIYRLKG